MNEVRRHFSSMSRPVTRLPIFFNTLAGTIDDTRKDGFFELLSSRAIVF